MAITTGSAQPNVTPLIDVLLTLLVIFMVITPMTPKGEDAIIPQPPTPTTQPPPDDTVVVQVAQGTDGEVELRLNHQPLAWADLQPRLTDIFKLRATRVMFVTAETSLPWMDIAQVVGIAHAAGVDKVSLMPANSEHSAS